MGRGTRTPKQVATAWQEAVAARSNAYTVAWSMTPEEERERDIAFARDLYVRDVIELDEFERRVARALAPKDAAPVLAAVSAFKRSLSLTAYDRLTPTARRE